MLLCVWQSLQFAWCDALRADISRGVPHAGLHELHDSDSPQRKVEKASAENVLKQHKACGVVTDRRIESFSSWQHCQQQSTLSPALPTSPAGDNVRTPGIRVPAQCC